MKQPSRSDHVIPAKAGIHATRWRTWIPAFAGMTVCILGLAFAGSAHAEELLTFQVVAKAGRLEPSRLEVPAGRKIKIQLRNEGPGPTEFESAELRVEKVLGPGASSFVVLHPLRPGTYRFFDEFHPDTGECIVIAK